MDISNGLVAVLIVAAIVVSLAGTVTTLNILERFGFGPGGGITGRSITGTVNVTVNESVTITWVKSRVDFFLNTPNSGLHPYRNDTSGRVESKGPFPLGIRNDGASTVNVSMYASQLFNLSAVSGASDNYFQAKCGKNTSICDASGGCAQYKSMQNFNKVNISTSGALKSQIIWNFSHWAGNDTLNIDLNVTVPPNEPAGHKTSTVTLIATASCLGNAICKTC